MNFQPDRSFGSGEYGSISNGGVALVDHAIAISPAEIRLGEDAGSTGTLVIRNGGSMTVQAGASGTGVLANGVNGLGTLVLHDNIGAVSLQRHTQNAASTLVAQLGGHGYPVKNHLWFDSARNWGYGDLPKDADEYKRRYINSVNRLAELRPQGVAGGVYTQTTDVEGEINGLLTYDRRVVKIPAEELARIHKPLHQ